MTIDIKDTEMSIIKESLEFDKTIMIMGLDTYICDMELLEKRHNMKTDTFISKFNSGELGDDLEWFDWLFAYKAYQHIKERIELIDSLNL